MRLVALEGLLRHSLPFYPFYPKYLLNGLDHLGRNLPIRLGRHLAVEVLVAAAAAAVPARLPPGTGCEGGVRQRPARVRIQFGQVAKAKGPCIAVRAVHLRCPAGCAAALQRVPPWRPCPCPRPNTQLPGAPALVV